MHDFSDTNASPMTEDPESAPAHFNGPPTQRCEPIAFSPDPWQDFWTSSIVPAVDNEELGIMDHRETLRPTGEVDLDALERHFAADSGVHRILSVNDDDREVDSIEAAVLKLLTG
jgi:hypothetical protein